MFHRSLAAKRGRASLHWGYCLALVLAALRPAPAAAQGFTDVFIFGDSLSDTGNACSVLGISGYAPGRCSNGDVWSERFAQMLGLSADASVFGGTNFAFGGDETSDLATQITEFSLSQLFRADPDALYVIWLGANDVLSLPSSPTAMQDAVNDIIGGIRDLRDLGAQHFLIVNLPDIGRAYGHFSLPTGSGSIFTPAERDAVTALSLDFNDRLAAALAAEPITTLYQLDIEALTEEAFANPTAFGLSPNSIDSTTDDTAFGIPCLIDPVCLQDSQGPIADTFFLFDSIHPTTAFHAVIAERATTLVPEPPLIAGLGACMLALAVLARIRGRRS